MDRPTLWALAVLVGGFGGIVAGIVANWRDKRR